MGVVHQISELIEQARSERRKKAALRMAEYHKASEGPSDAQTPEPLTRSSLNSILMAIATHRAIPWQFAWALIHRIRVLESEPEKYCPQCECDCSEERPQHKALRRCEEKVAGMPRTKGR